MPQQARSAARQSRRRAASGGCTTAPPQVIDPTIIRDARPARVGASRGRRRVHLTASSTCPSLAGRAPRMIASVLAAPPQMRVLTPRPRTPPLLDHYSHGTLIRCTSRYHTLCHPQAPHHPLGDHRTAPPARAHPRATKFPGNSARIKARSITCSDEEDRLGEVLGEAARSSERWRGRRHAESESPGRIGETVGGGERGEWGIAE